MKTNANLAKMELDYALGFTAGCAGLPMPKDTDKWGQISRGHGKGRLMLDYANRIDILQSTDLTNTTEQQK